MRDIIFRGKRIDNGEWVYGAFCPKSCDDPFGPMVDKPSIIKLDTPCDGWWFDVDPSTVSQYTGLTDKNGDRIFEGDIVRVKHGYCGNPKHPTNELIETVSYNPRSCCYEFYRWSGDIYEVEVIGNIHDNPELLKEEST